MGWHRGGAVTQARSENEAENESGPTRGHVHHRSTGKIDRLDSCVGIEWAAHKPVGGPDHVGHGKVDDKHPDQAEE